MNYRKVLCCFLFVFTTCSFTACSFPSRNTVSTNTISQNTTVSENRGNGNGTILTAEEITRRQEEEGIKEEPEENEDPFFVGYTKNGHTIQEIDGVTYIDGTIVVNKTYSLPEDYDPGDLTPVVSAAFDKMVAAAAEEGVRLFSISSYRSYDLQGSLYQTYLNRTGNRDYTDTFSARPGYSEHQTGMAIDFNSCLTTFANTKEGVWLAEHATEYGFILRYPEGKEEITGFIYEPWHFRYVGVELAKEITASGLCLEEYYGIDSVYSEECDEWIKTYKPKPVPVGTTVQPIPTPAPVQNIDPVTGCVIDATTGLLYNPVNGIYFDPNTYAPVDPSVIVTPVPESQPDNIIIPPESDPLTVPVE